MADKIDLFDAIHTMRAMRRLKPDPVPDDLIRKIINAGLCAPSGGDMQNWRFIVVKDPEIKRQIQIRYKRALDTAMAHFHAAPIPGKTDAQKQRRLSAVEYLTEHFHETPVLIVACLIEGNATQAGIEKAAAASIYPAVQNMLLAARGLGLGATLTTRHLLYEKEVDEVLGLPPNAGTYAIIPIGYPMGRFGPLSRLALEQVTFSDRWGNAWN